MCESVEKQLSAVVTTGYKYHQENVELAQRMAVKLQIPYVERGTASFPDLRRRWGVENILVARQGLLFLEKPSGELFFHPNMAHLRVKNLRFGKKDHLVEALALKEGDSVLDCTLGLGADAIVESYAVGETGSVTGVESQPLIEAVVGHGLANLAGETELVTAAMRRVQTVCMDSLSYLQQQPDDSVDAVYFDPMFRHPLLSSENLQPLRGVADDRPLTEETIAEACRVARHRVVMKENARSLEFARLGFDKIVGGRYSKVHYGVKELS